jgi:Protein of unknown function (DUF1838)
MDRRELITIGAAGAAGIAFGASPVLAKLPAKAPRTPLNRSLKGDFLDLTTTAGNREAYARIMGDTDMRSTKYGWYSGMVHGVRPGEKIVDLFGFSGFSCARLIPQEPGADRGYKKILREVGFYTDLKTGEVLEEWTNPYLNETVKVVPIANDPFNHTITDFHYAPPTYGGLNSAIPPKRPFLLDWTRRGDTLNLARRINLFYPSALQPDKWPRESSGKFNQVTEIFLFQIDWNEMQNPKQTAVGTQGSWSRVTPWLPWMLMGPTPGHCIYSCFMGSGDTLELADPKIVDYAKKHYPKYLEAPDRWEEPSLSSLEWYARQQTPAKLPADGKIPVAIPLK